MSLGIYKYHFVFTLLIAFASYIATSHAQVDSISQHKEREKVRFRISDQLVTKYVPRVGIQIGEGFSNQSMAQFSYSGFKAFGWWNYGIPDQEFTGIIYGLQYKQNIPINFSKISVNAVLALNKYIFPTVDMDNWVADYYFNVKGRVHASFQYSHVFTAGTITHGDRLFGMTSYPFNYRILNQKSVIIPNISSAYHWNFYNKNGLAHFTIGVKNKITFQKISIHAFINYQHSFNSVKAILKSGFYGGFGFDFSGIF